ncbi:MAG: hypothetical protein ACREYE_07720, partial [Gammaproteobacteria bacterium]
ATVEDIIKKIERARVKMEQIKPGSTLPRGKKEGGLTVKLFKGHYTSTTEVLDDEIKLNEAVSGFGDTVSFGLTKKIRQAGDFDSTIDYNSIQYKGGQVAGYAHQAL